MPIAVLEHKSPFEALYEVKPSCEHLRAFGCLCYGSTLKRHRDKLHLRAHPYIFLGYPYSQKAYKLLDLETHKIFTSRDVHFHENIFPFHHIPQQNATPLPIVIEYLP